MWEWGACAARVLLCGYLRRRKAQALTLPLLCFLPVLASTLASEYSIIDHTLRKDMMIVRNMSGRRRWGILASAFFCIALSGWFSIPAYADGGAPNLAYVSGAANGISVIDVGKGKVTRTIALAGNPAMILLSPDGRWLYTTQPALGQVSVLIAKTGQALCTAHLPGHPSALALSLDAALLYAGGDGAASVAAINPATCRVQHTYHTDGAVYGLWVTAIGTIGATSGQLWVTGPTSLSIFDINGPLIKTIPIAGGPQHICIPSGVTAYVTTRQGTVDAIDIQTWTVRQMLAGGQYGSMDYDGLSLEVYVPDTLHGVIDILAPPPSSNASLPAEPERILHTQAPPVSVAVTNDGLFGFVALQGGKVTVFDLIDHNPVYTLSVGGTPHFIITGLYPPAVTIPPATPSSQQAAAPGNTLLIAVLAILSAACILALFLVLLWIRRKSVSHTG